MTVTLVCEERNIKQLTAVIERFTNLFTEESDDLFNLVTKVVVADKVNDDLCGQSVIGRKLLQSFVNEKIKSDKVNVWSKMKKRQLLPYMEKQWKETEGLSERQSCGFTLYMAQKSMEYAVQNGRRLVVSWACQCRVCRSQDSHYFCLLK